MDFLFCMFLKTLCHESCKAKKTNKIQLLPSLQQEIKEVEGMKENKHSIIVWLVFLSVILKDQCGEYSRHYHLRLPYYYTII